VTLALTLPSIPGSVPSPPLGSLGGVHLLEDLDPLALVGGRLRGGRARATDPCGGFGKGASLRGPRIGSEECGGSKCQFNSDTSHLRAVFCAGQSDYIKHHISRKWGNLRIRLSREVAHWVLTARFVFVGLDPELESEMATERSVTMRLGGL